MKKSTKILLCLSAAFISVGAVLAIIGMFLGVHPYEAFNEGLMDFKYYEKRSTEFSPEGRYTIPAEGLKELTIDWLDGDIIAEPYDGDEILLVESSFSALDENSALTYKAENGVLSIIYSPGQAGIRFSPAVYDSKDLHIYIPENIKLDAASLSAADSDLELRNMSLETLTVEVVDGDVSLQGVALAQLNFDSMDGSLSTTASEIAEVYIDTVDGDLSCELLSCPQSLRFNGISGDIKLYLPADSQFSIKMDSMNGEFESEFKGSYRNDCYTVGDASASFEFSLLSGDIELIKTK